MKFTATITQEMRPRPPSLQSRRARAYLPFSASLLLHRFRDSRSFSLDDVVFQGRSQPPRTGSRLGARTSQELDPEELVAGVGVRRQVILYIFQGARLASAALSSRDCEAVIITAGLRASVDSSCQSTFTRSISSTVSRSQPPTFFVLAFPPILRGSFPRYRREDAKTPISR